MFGLPQAAPQTTLRHRGHTRKGYRTLPNDDQTPAYGYPDPGISGENRGFKAKYVVKHAT